ncbi:pyrroline-5-carboxylate reductase [Nocardioides sp. LHG3406-4]|uniref:pyrroline-5-carboxylate reductase n=1 Tax=Nocardioides sp. LHG3406-4 TaxID=2804575 RepID=UPI003CF935C1
MTQRFAVLGAGVIGETMVSSILRAGHPATALVVSERHPERAAELRQEYGVAVTCNNPEAVRGATVILLAVKPADVWSLLVEISVDVEPGATVVSLVSGVGTATMEAALPRGVAVVRVMPNTPAIVGAGMFGVSPGSDVSAEQLAQVVSLLETGGRVAVVDESLQDGVTAVSGSGPAYVFYLAEAMIAAGVATGLSADVALLLTQQTLVGAARLLDDADDTPQELRRRVTSPNGTTAAAVAVFDERGVKDALVAGMLASAARSAELSEPGA